MLTTTVFTASVPYGTGFVVWTVSSPTINILNVGARRTVSTPSLRSSGRSEGELGSGLPFPYRRRVPRIWRVTSAGCPTDCPGQINSRCYYWLMKKQSNCSVCGHSLSGQQSQYCSTRCKNKVHQSYDAQKKRGINRKLLLVKQRGGCCSRCGYKRNLSALTFHHVSGKEFKLDMRSLSNRTFDSVLKEVAKCRLVCQNCHAELHNPDLDLKVLS